MSHNPFLNAALAELYVILVSLGMFYGPKEDGQVDTVFAPIAMLSLFVFSASVMGYLFLYRPGEMYFSGEKKAAAAFFLKTVFSFGCFTALAFAGLFYLK